MPDGVSAMRAAQRQGSRVLVTDWTTASSRSWANPDGTVTTELASAPVRVRQADGSWADTDLSLVQGSAGRWGPRVGVSGVSLSGGGADRSLVSLARSGRSVGLSWPGALPAPVVSGTTATYPDVVPGGDLRVEVSRSGFRLGLVLRSRPATAPVLTLPLAMKGLSVSQAPDGSLVFTDAGGAGVAFSRPARMWDAQTDPSGQPSHIAPVAVTVAPGGSSLTLRPDAAFLADPSTVYPVTIDPDTSWQAQSDTYVRSDSSTSQYSSALLYSGATTVGSSTVVARSYLSFSSGWPTALEGKQIRDAYLSIWNSYSGSCTASAVATELWSVTAGFSSSTVWSNKPSAGTKYGSANFAGGGPTCATGVYASIPATGLVQGWADGTIATKALQLSAASETSTLGYRGFWSSENANHVPTMQVTSNYYPTVSRPHASPSMVSGATTYVSSLTPDLYALVSDQDASLTHADVDVYWGATKQISALQGGAVSAGQYSHALVPSAQLVDGRTYAAWIYSADAYTRSKAPATTTFTVDVTAPGTSTVSSSTFTANAWTATRTGTFSFAATDGGSGVDHYLYDLDRSSPTTATAAGSSSASLTVPGGWHVLYARAVDKAGNLGPVANYPFGAATGLTTPADGTVTGASVSLRAASGGTGHQVSFYWRRSANDAWALVPTSRVTPASGSPAFTSWPYDYTTALTNGQSTPGLNFDLSGALSGVDGPAQIAACFGTSTTCTTSPGTTLPSSVSSDPSNVTLDTKAFNTAETTDLGPVGVNLVTGNTQLSATDLNVAGSSGTSLSVSRVLNTATVANTAGNAAAGSGHYTSTGVFGPGWTGSLPVDSAGADWTGLTDTGSVLTLQGPDQSTIAFTQNGTGTWQPTGQDADSLLTLTPDTSANCPTGHRCYLLTDSDTTTVLFDAATTNSGTLAAPVAFTVTRVTEPGTPGSTTYSSSSGLVTRILSPVPSGLTCTATGWSVADSSTWQPGCRALELNYGSGTSAGQLTSATYVTSDGTNPLAIDVACWAYDSNGRLTDTWDPRDIPTAATGTHQISCGATALRATHYDYDTSGRVTKVTPAWNGTSSPIAGTTLSYDGNGRLSHVDRAHLDASGTEVTSVAYGVSLTPDGTHPEYRPDMTNTAAWGQTDSPNPTTGGTAICPPGTSQATNTGDLRPCTISYLDANGRTVNTASYSGTGASGWHIATTEYDALGHTIRTLDPANREEALSPTTGAGATLGLPSDAPAAAAALSNLTLYGISPGDANHPSDGQPDILDSYGPYHLVTLADGTSNGARLHTHYVYDNGSETGHPAGSPLHLVTSITTGASQGLGATPVAETDQRTSSNVYAVGTDTTGWTYRTPLKTITDPAGLNIVKQVVLDPATGLVTESRMPNDVASTTPGATAGTTKTVYYSKNTISGPDSDCGNAPLWDSLVCKTYPADLAPTGGAPNLITTKTSYDPLGRVTSVVETPSGDTTHARTSTVVYGFNSTISSGVSANPWANTAQQSATTGGLGTTLPARTTTFDPDTGLPTALSDGTTADSTSYDDFGRVTAYTENTSATGTQANTANTVYDATSGRVTSSRDQHHRTTYTYNQNGEYRGLPTTMQQDVTATNNGSALWSGTFTGSYDANGRVATQTDPNSVTSTLTRDEDGQLLSRADVKGGTQWLNDTATFTIDGQQASHTGPTGAQTYTYDIAGRLTTVQDTPTAGPCTTRTYSYDRNGNRLTKNIYPAASDKTCSTATTGVTTLNNYDAADRLLATGTVYDSFGRTTTAPASTVTGAADVTIGYWPNDLVATQSQTTVINSVTTLTVKNFTLDQTQQRLRTVSTAVNGAAPATTRNHYDDAASDSPAWTLENSSGTAWTVNVTDLLGSLAATVDQNGTATLQYTNLHGDIQAKAAVGATTPTIADGYDEFGCASGVPAARYGWLGGKQRSAEDLGGLLLMGVRLYNPSTGRFLQVDPVTGGSANDYDYVYQDPINKFDLGGTCWGGGDWCHPLKQLKKHWKGLAQIAGGVIFTAAACFGTVGIGCAVIAGAVYGASYGGYDYAFTHRDHFSQSEFLKRSVIGGLKGGILPFGIGKATEGHTTGLAGVAKRILKFTFGGHKNRKWL